jgi:GNAT superfamily N-acetyltransferase
MAVVLRAARSDDVTTLTSLTAELGYPEPEAEIRRRFELLAGQPDHRIIVAEEGGEVVGLMSFHVLDLLYGSGRLGRITAIVVTNSMRGKGLGRLLVEKAEEFAREEGCNVIELTTNNRRLEAHKFYESLGYAATHKRFTKSLE